MNAEKFSNQGFFAKRCSLAAIATGVKANSLTDLRDRLVTIEEGSIYFHFWGGRMNPQFVHTQHHNDFARWVYFQLHDPILAEKLNIIDPTEFDNLEGLRGELIETIDRRLDDYETVFWTKKEAQFHFVRSIIIVFESTLKVSDPKELPKLLNLLPPSSIFYHFIDARSRTSEKLDDFSMWLKGFGSQYETLIEDIQSIDPYFLSLVRVKEELTHVIQNYFSTEGPND